MGVVGFKKLLDQYFDTIKDKKIKHLIIRHQEERRRHARNGRPPIGAFNKSTLSKI